MRRRLDCPQLATEEGPSDTWLPDAKRLAGSGGTETGRHDSGDGLDGIDDEESKQRGQATRCLQAGM